MKVGMSADGAEEFGTYVVNRTVSLSEYLRASIGEEVLVVPNQNPTRAMQDSRNSRFSIVIGPSQVIGSALKYGYEPVARFDEDVSVVAVVAKSSGIKSIEGAKGRRIGLPGADSLATYLFLGEIKDKGINVKDHFKEVTHFLSEESALELVVAGIFDVAVVKGDVAKAWLEKNGAKGEIIYQTKSVPGTSIAMLGSLDDKTKDRIRNAFLNPRSDLVAKSGVSSLLHMHPSLKDDYVYVAHLGYFTPQSLSGAKMVSADQVQGLVTKGATLYDVRSAAEYRDKHVKGAISLPYSESSSKAVDFDQTKDEFSAGALATDKNAPVIFYCNGGECWKSYKASSVAVKAGYTTVYWFRGGFPEWRAAGLPIEAQTSMVKN
jgi:ABC-type phosphate/phosphonate transport system substrate-binding protein/rhodanese-related sulfurtransferase